MNRTRIRILAIVVVIAILAAIAAMVYSSNHSDELIGSAMKDQISDNLKFEKELLSEKDNITVYTIGTAAMLPSSRSQSCTAVIANGQLLIFDVGDGAVSQMEKMNLPVEKISGVFISHFHSDHYVDLPYLISRSWLRGRDTKLDVYGPSGIKNIIAATDQFLEIDNQHRTNLHGKSILDSSVAGARAHQMSVADQGSSLVYDQHGIKVTAFVVGHEPVSPDYGFLIEYKGKKVVLSGDTAKNQNVTKHAEGADLLIHEAMLMELITQLSDINTELGDSKRGQLLAAMKDYHSSPIEAAEVAAEAGVAKLVLSHLAPTPDRKVLERMYKRGLDDIYSGPIILADDGDKFIIN